MRCVHRLPRALYEDVWMNMWYANVLNRTSHTNVDRFNADSLLNMGDICIIGDLVCKNFRLAERVDEGGTTCARST